MILFCILICCSLGYAQYKESGDGLSLSITGDGSINSSSVHSLSYDKFIDVSIEDGINRIESESFIDCINLVKIRFPSKLEYLGSSVFENCYNLESIDLPEGLKSIDKLVFKFCKKLKNITISSTIESIDPTFLSMCGKLEKFIVNTYNKNFSTLRNGEILTSYTKETGIKCKGFGKIIIPSQIEILDTYFCYNLEATEFVFEENSKIKILNDNLFFDSGKITSLIIPASLERIEANAFTRSSLVNITIQSTCKYISPKAFNDCKALQNLFIPDDCLAIKKIDGVIYDSSSTNILFIPLDIDNLTIPANMKNFEASLVRTTKSLKYVHVEDGNLFFSEYDDALYSFDKYYFKANPYLKETIKIHKDCKVIEFQALKYSMIRDVYFEGNITEIRQESFSACPQLRTINFPESIETIGSWVFTQDAEMKVDVVFGPNLTTLSKSAFYGSGILSVDLSRTSITQIIAQTFCNCKYLSILKLPPNCQIIESECFYGTAISEIKIGNRIESIGESAFRNCNKLVNIQIDDGSALESIDVNAFASTKISQIILPYSLVSIGAKSFQNCANLFNITFIDTITNPGNLESIAADAFNGCNLLEEVRLPKSIRSLNPTSFSICKKLMNIIIGDGVVYQSVEGAVFSKDKLTLVICPNGRSEFTIEQSVRYIGHKAFMNCKNLNNLVFERNSLVESLNTSVFEGCDALKYVIFSDNSALASKDSGSRLVEIGDKVFSGCTSLEEFKFPSSVRYIGNNAFDGCIRLKTSLPKSLECIGSNAFNGCSSLERIDLGANVRSIGAGCFFGCSNLITVTYCGLNNLNTNKTINSKDVNCFVLPTYPADLLGGISVFKQLDAGCNIPTAVFTTMRNDTLQYQIAISVLWDDEDRQSHIQ